MSKARANSNSAKIFGPHFCTTSSFSLWLNFSNHYSLLSQCSLWMTFNVRFLISFPLFKNTKFVKLIFLFQNNNIQDKSYFLYIILSIGRNLYNSGRTAAVNQNSTLSSYDELYSVTFHVCVTLTVWFNQFKNSLEYFWAGTPTYPIQFVMH